MPWFPYTNVQLFKGRNGHVVTYDQGFTRAYFDRNGKLHRDPKDGAAYVELFRNEYIARYFWHGVMHRESGPAELKFDINNGFVFEQRWVKNGWLHRNPSEGPALEIWHSPDNCGRIGFYWYGYEYRDPHDGPEELRFNRLDEPERTHYARKPAPTRPPTRQWLQKNVPFRHSRLYVPAH